MAYDISNLCVPHILFTCASSLAMFMRTEFVPATLFRECLFFQTKTFVWPGSLSVLLLLIKLNATKCENMIFGHFSANGHNDVQSEMLRLQAAARAYAE